MSTSATIGLSQGIRSTTTVRQFGRAVGTAVVAVALGCAIYGIETFLLRSRHRFMESPTEVMMRTLGLAHFLIGWLFLLTSPRLRNASSLARLACSTLLGVGLCAGFGLSGAGKNPFAVMAFYGLFLIHEVRDEAHLYQVYDRGMPQRDEVLSCLSSAVAAFLMTVLASAYLVHGFLKQHSSVTETPLLLFLGGMAALTAATAWLVGRTCRVATEQYGSLRVLARAHGPLLLVYGGIFTILLVGSCFGSAGFNLIILVHVTAWLVFVHHQLGQHGERRGVSPPVRPCLDVRWWPWLRTSPSGFLVLHLGVALVILLLLGLRVHVWHRSGWLSQLLAGSSFPYWSLMHIGMSFWRGR